MRAFVLLSFALAQSSNSAQLDAGAPSSALYWSAQYPPVPSQAGYWSAQYPPAPSHSWGLQRTVPSQAGYWSVQYLTVPESVTKCRVGLQFDT